MKVCLFIQMVGKESKMKKFLLLCFSLLILSPVYASNDIVDLSKKGSLSITLVNEEYNEKVVGAEIEVIKVGTVGINNNNLAYSLIPELSNCNISLSNILDESLKGKIVNCVNSNNYNGSVGTTDESGKVGYNDLDLGLYLIKQNNILEGYSAIDSYLITIPTLNDNLWVYDIDSVPKTEIIKMFSLNVRKIWKTDKELPDFITIELLLDGEIKDTVKLGKDNDWKYTWEKIPYSDKYTVREKDSPKGYTTIYDKDDTGLIVINAANLPQTGQHIYIIYICSIVGLICISVGMYLNKRDKYE